MLGLLYGLLGPEAVSPGLGSQAGALRADTSY